MSYARDDFMAVGMGILVVLFLLAAGLVAATNVLYRTGRLEREVATRRVLGARRSHIVTMFLLEGMSGVLGGVLVGGVLSVCAFMLLPMHASFTSILISVLALMSAGAIGSWFAARHAANTPFRKSGLFCAAPDRRGE